MQSLLTKMVLLLILATPTIACKPFRDNNFSNLKDGPTGDVTTRFVPKSAAEQRTEVETVMQELELFCKEKASAAISSGDPAKIDAAMAEWMSVRHQLDNLRALDPQKNAGLFRELGLSPDAVQGMREGILDSDKGKIKEYKQLLVEESARSNKLFDTLRGNEQGSVKSTVIQEFNQIMKEMGFSGKTILNRQTTNEQFREIMKNSPGAQGYLHDLPGIVDAVEMREKGFISAERFKERVKANLFHNGPDAGFWGKLKGFIFKDPAMIKTMFEGTVFIDRTGNMTYPGSKSIGGILHRMVDRISQATRGGILKIVYEIRSFSPNTKSLGELTLQSPELTVQQLEVTRNDIREAAKQGLIKDFQANRLIELTTRAIERVQTHAKLTQARIRNAEAVKASVDAFKTPSSIEVVDDNGVIDRIAEERTNGKIYAPEEMLVELIERGDATSMKLYEQLTNPELIDNSLKIMDQTVASIEAKGTVGDPMRPVAESSLATQAIIERAAVQSRERTRQAMEYRQEQRQAAQNAAMDRLNNRFNSAQRQQANNIATQTQQVRQIGILDVMNVENFTRRPGVTDVHRLRFSFTQQIEADPELKRQMQELERAAREMDVMREKVKTGQANRESAASYRRVTRIVTEARTRVIDTIRAKAVRGPRL